MGLRDCAIGRVSEPVDSLEPRAVTKMETRNGIDWRTTFIAGTEIIPRCSAHQRLFQPAEDFGVSPPMRTFHQLEYDAIGRVDSRRVFILQFFGQPTGETGHGR